MVAHSDLEGMFSLGAGGQYCTACACFPVAQHQLAQRKKKCFEYCLVYLFSCDCSHIGITRFSFWYLWKIWIKQLCPWVLLLVLWQRWVIAVRIFYVKYVCTQCMASVQFPSIETMVQLRLICITLKPTDIFNFCYQCDIGGGWLNISPLLHRPKPAL